MSEQDQTIPAGWDQLTEEQKKILQDLINIYIAQNKANLK